MRPVSRRIPRCPGDAASQKLPPLKADAGPINGLTVVGALSLAGLAVVLYKII